MKTRLIKISLSLTVLLFVSCFGDKKAVDVAEMNNTSFINKNFKGNLINYDKDMSACENISVADIASLYTVPHEEVVFSDISKSDRRVPNSNPACQFFIKIGASDFEWPRGSMSIVPDVNKDDDMIDIAEAAGHSEKWEEAWALNKSISKSSEWIEGMGMAAVWNEKKKELKIKFKGYTLYVLPLRSALNKEEIAKNRDYKSIAIKMAKASGFVN